MLVLDRLKRKFKKMAQPEPQGPEITIDGKTIKLGRCAHVCIDLDTLYPWPGDEEVARQVGEHIAPGFRELDIPNYWVCIDFSDYYFGKNTALKPPEALAFKR
jgi:hypothetical protein